MKPNRIVWIVLHALLLVLALGCADALLLKFARPWASLLPWALVAILGLALVIGRVARRVPAERRSVLHRTWCALDGVGTIWLVFLAVLLTIFHEAFVRASGDGREYFAQLHSVVMDRDLDLSNEAVDFGARYAAGFPFGSAVLWMPFYLAAHVWLGVLNVFGGGFRQDGYFYPYQMAVGLGTLAYGFAGLILIYRVACDYFSRWLSLWSTLAVAAGSFVVWYLAIDNSYTHGNSLFAVTLFLFIWHRTRLSRSWPVWGLLGVAGGLMMMVRWQNATFLAPLALDVVSGAWRAFRRRDRAGLTRLALAAATAAAGVVVGFLPQMYFLKVVHGGWLQVPHYQAGQQWWSDSVMVDVLFSSNHGLFAWHPIVYASVVGAPLFLKRDWRLGGLLLGMFLAQVYVNGAVATWWGGSAFGGRRFDGCVMFFVLGLAALIHWGMRRPALLVTCAIVPFLAVNAIFMRAVATHVLPMGEGISADRIIPLERLGNPFSFPANALFAWRYGTSPAFYDRLGSHLYTNVAIDVGEPGDERFLMGGWSRRQSGQYGTFRWGLGRESTMALALLGPRYVRPGEPQQFWDYVLRLRADPYAFDGSPPQVLQIAVNGRPLAERTLDPGFQEYEFDVPPAFLRRSVNVIAFRYSLSRSPLDPGREGDTRELAARFDYIRLVVKPRP